MNTFTHIDIFDGVSSDGDLIISEPDFLEEIKSCERFKGCFSTTTVNYLRSIAAEFGNKYDKNFNPYRNIIPTDFQGIPFKTHNDLTKIVKQMFIATYPQIFKSYLESKISGRPFNCKHIIVVGFNSNTVKNTMDSFDFVESVKLDDKQIATKVDLIYCPDEGEDQELLSKLEMSIDSDNKTTEVSKTKKLYKNKDIHS